MKHEPGPDEYPDGWADAVVDLEDVAALDHHPALDGACLRLLREIAYRSQNDHGCCWQGRAAFQACFGWTEGKLDRHRDHLKQAGLLQEVVRRPRTTLRRIRPRRVRELAEEARAWVNTLTSGALSFNTLISRAFNARKNRAFNTLISGVEGEEGGEEGGEEAAAASAPERARGGASGAGSSPPSSKDSPSGGASGEDETVEPSPGKGVSRRDGDRPPKWHRTLGEHPETGLEVRVGRNENGPYVAMIDPEPGHERSEWRNLPDGALGASDEQLEAVTLEDAVKFLEMSRRVTEGLYGRFGFASPEERVDHNRQIDEKVPVIGGSPDGEEGADE